VSDILKGFTDALKGVSEVRSVGTATDLAVADRAPQSHQRPAVWVVPEQESGQGERFTDAPGQMVEARIAVMICMGTPGRARGDERPAELAVILGAVRTAIAGIDSLSPLPRFHQGQMVRVAPGEIWWKDTWICQAPLIPVSAAPPPADLGKIIDTDDYIYNAGFSQALLANTVLADTASWADEEYIVFGLRGAADAGPAAITGLPLSLVHTDDLRALPPATGELDTQNALVSRAYLQDIFLGKESDTGNLIFRSNPTKTHHPSVIPASLRLARAGGLERVIDTAHPVYTQDVPTPSTGNIVLAGSAGWGAHEFLVWRLPSSLSHRALPLAILATMDLEALPDISGQALDRTNALVHPISADEEIFLGKESDTGSLIFRTEDVDFDPAPMSLYPFRNVRGGAKIIDTDNPIFDDTLTAAQGVLGGDGWLERTRFSGGSCGVDAELSGGAALPGERGGYPGAGWWAV